MLGRFTAATAAHYQERNRRIVAEYEAAGFGERYKVAEKYGLSYETLRGLVSKHRQRERRGGYSFKQWMAPRRTSYP